MNFFKKKDHEGNMVAETEEDLSVSGQLKKIIEHLAFLEKKLDTLLEQSGQRRSSPPRFGNRGFGRPSRDYRSGHSGPMGHSDHSNHSRPMGYSGHSDRPSGGYHSKFSGGGASHGHSRPSHGPRRSFPKRHHSPDQANPGNQL